MIGTALVGFGWWGQHMAPRLKDHVAFDLRCVVEPAVAAHGDIAKLGLAPVPSYDAAIADPSVQAVILTSPNDLHDSQIAQAVAAGKHVFCEKPLSLSASNARISVESCRAASLVLGIGHERRF